MSAVLQLHDEPKRTCPLSNEEVLSHILGNEILTAPELAKILMVSICTIQTPSPTIMEYLCQIAKTAR